MATAHALLSREEFAALPGLAVPVDELFAGA
jgi:hypothetical protein